MRRTVYMKKQYDYLLVGSGLFAGVAYYAKKPERPASFLRRENMQAETSTAKISRASTYTATVPISSIPVTGKSGTL